jgi:hypothetical protein
MRLQLIKYLIGPEPVIVLTTSLIFPIQIPAKSWRVSWLKLTRPLVYAHGVSTLLKNFVRLVGHVASMTDMRARLGCQLLKSGHDFLSVFCYVYFREYLHNFACLVDDECYAVCGCLSVLQYAIGIGDSLVFVADERKR